MAKQTDIKKVYLHDLRKENLNKLIIPNYQRKYTWSNENVVQLISDIYENNFDLEYFLGTIILQSNMTNSYLIIDGQQRLSTVLLIMKVLEIEYNKKYNLEEFSFESKNDIDLDYLQKLIRCANPYKENNKSNYYSNIIAIRNEILNIKDFNRFINNFDKTFLTVVFMPNEINQFKVFSTINSTGIPLSTLELVKSFLISRFEEYNSDKALDELLNIFNYIDKHKDLEKKSDDLIRYFIAFQTNNELLTKFTNILYKGFLEIFNKAIDKENFLKLWNNFYKFSVYYFYLLSDEFQEKFNSMIILNPSINTYSVLIIDVLMNHSNFSKFEFSNKNIFDQIQLLNDKEIDKCLKLIEYYRLNIVFDSTNEKEITRKTPMIPNKINDKINYSESLYSYFFNNQSIKTIKELMILLCEKPIYELNNNLTLALFKRIEHNSNNKETNLKTVYSIEHILPQEPSKWEKNNPNNLISMQPFVHTICNLTLLTKRNNTSFSNELWKIKKEKLIDKDNITINNKLRTFNEWDMDSMEEWTKFLLKKIFNIWNFNEYNNQNDINIDQFLLDFRLSNLKPKGIERSYSYWISHLRSTKKNNPQLEVNPEIIKQALKIKVVEDQNVDKIIGINSNGFFVQAIICILFETNSVKDIRMNDTELNVFINKNINKINQIVEDVNYS